MQKNNKLFVMLILALLSGNSQAERLLATKGFAGQPLVTVQDGAIQSCGIRFVGINTPSKKNETIWIADASFLIDKSDQAVVKASIIKSSINRFNKAQIPLFETFKTFQVKAQKIKATRPVRGTAIEVDRDGSKRYVTDMASVKGIYQAIMDKKPIQLNYIFADKQKNITIQGQVMMPDEELAQVSSCLGKLGK